ncbi:MAG: hypothetical protein FWE37_04225 [Spirochaetaceae bacterium]|nr:hypothetical protein [Spirochaetaceae bacterium]
MALTRVKYVIDNGEIVSVDKEYGLIDNEPLKSAIEDDSPMPDKEWFVKAIPLNDERSTKTSKKKTVSIRLTQAYLTELRKKKDWQTRLNKKIGEWLASGAL